MGAGLESGAAEGGDDDDDEVPDLVENFDEASKDEKATEDVKISEGEWLDNNWCLLTPCNN